MTKRELKASSVDRLVDRFVENSVAQDEALLYDDVRTANRLINEMRRIEDELHRREGDQRRALVALYHHGNMQVRLNAAKAMLDLVPSAAREALQAIRESKAPQALDAGMCLWNLDRGVFKPT